MKFIEPFLFKKKGHKTHTPDTELKTETHTFVFKNLKDRKYIVRVEKYNYDLYIIKFYPDLYKDSPSKFNVIINDNEARRTIYTCIEIGLTFYRENDLASFAFVGMPTEEELNRDDNKKYYNTKRLRVYKAFALYFFNPEKFQHKYSEKTSFYLICNKKSRKKTKKLSEKIIDMLGDYYTF